MFNILLFAIGYLRIKLKAIQFKYQIFTFSKKNNFSCNLDVCMTGPLENLLVGNNTTINSLANFRFKKGKISIGENCLIARNVTIITQTYNIDKEVEINLEDTIVKDVKVGNNVWVGSNTVIMPGVIIGNGSVIGSGSIVTRDIQIKRFGVECPRKK